MHPVSEKIIGQILNPKPMADTPPSTTPVVTLTMEQVVHPRPASGPYAGPERRAQGYLIAEAVAPTPAAVDASAHDSRA